MRNWNFEKFCYIKIKMYSVFIVPMRNWNPYCKPNSNIDKPLVFIVPMRNWNRAWVLYLQKYLMRFYRTYEELKHVPDHVVVIIRELGVFIVPMRNWNYRASHAILLRLRLFLSYLWGIETSFPAKLWTGSFRFLSYLWGIETSKNNSSGCIWIYRFYRTYEELKHP